MKKADKKEKYLYLFSAYSHNIPVIYSSLEGQHDGELYIDSEDNPQIAILFTQFAFHFVAGNPDTKNAVDVLDEIVFKQYLLESNQKEAIIFTPDSTWDKVLDIVFQKHKGFKEKRKIYHLNRDKFVSLQAVRKAPTDVEIVICSEQAGGANNEYPTCRILKGNECISYCSSIMVGKSHAEIDVYTVDEYRRKGYAKAASISLINELLKSELEPDWNTWPYRTESQQLALSLGYELINEIPAHIWVEAECGKIE